MYLGIPTSCSNASHCSRICCLAGPASHISVRALCCCFRLFRDLPLRRLEVIGSGLDETWSGASLIVSRCLTLEALFMTCDEYAQTRLSSGLHGMHLQGMPSLRYLRLQNCFPAHELSLPAGCALHLDVKCDSSSAWHEHWEKCQLHARTLTLDCTDYRYWLPGIQCLSHLQYLDLRVCGLPGQDLADLQHIAHVRVL